MRNISVKRLKNIGLVLLLMMVMVVVWVALVTHTSRNITNANPLYFWAIEHHLSIMVVLVVLSVAFGFLWSNIFYSEIEKKSKDTKSIIDIVFLFLNKEERDILEFIIKSNGETTQSDISKLPGMSRVKAFRSLQKMYQKNLIEINAHGKLRKIRLKENIMNAIRD